jgi:hypothetical protein
MFRDQSPTSHPRGWGALNLPIVAGYLLTLYALGQILFVLYLWFNHFNAPLGLGPLEPNILQSFQRAAQGQPIYPEPTSEYVPFAYNPLYYFLGVPLAWITGATLPTLRLLNIAATFASAVIIFRAVLGATGSRWWSFMTVGLFAAAYSALDSAHDRVHPDACLLVFVLLGCYVLSGNTTATRRILAAVLFLAAFWLKQHGALFGIGAATYLTWREGWSKSLPFWILLVLLGFGLYIAAPDWLFGSRFHYFTWEVPRHWTEVNRSTFTRLVKYTGGSYFFLAIAGVTASGFALLRRGFKINIWYFMLPVALLSGLMGSLDPGSSNNVFFLMGVWLIVTGALGFSQLSQPKGSTAHRLGLLLLTLSFALLYYPPGDAIVSANAPAAYQDLVAYLRSLGGPVYVPTLGQLPYGFQLYPGVPETALDDLLRGPGADDGDRKMVERLLEPVANPQGTAYILTYRPLPNDKFLHFLAPSYTLSADLGDRFEALEPLKTGRYRIAWPRYLYKYCRPETPASSREP